MTLGAPRKGIRIPASAGPARAAKAVPPSITLLACAIVVSSSPTSSGRITRWAAKYGAMKQPSAKTSASRSGKLSRSAEWRSGSETRSGIRAASQTSIVVRAPSRSTTVPLGIPRIAIGRISTARTRVIFEGDPVVTSTHHGRARYVIREPRIETISAATSAAIGVLRIGSSFADLAIIVRPYVFVKCAHAEGHAGAQGSTPRADLGRRPASVRAARVRGRDGRSARGGDRALPRRDLQLLREQGGALRRARAPLVRPVRRDLARRGISRAARCDRARGSRLALGAGRGGAANAHGRTVPGADRASPEGDGRPARVAPGAAARPGPRRRSDRSDRALPRHARERVRLLAGDGRPDAGPGPADDADRDGRGAALEAELRRVGAGVDRLQLLHALDVVPCLRELDLAALLAPAVDVRLAGVVRRERQFLVVVLVEQVTEIPRAVANVQLRVDE